MPDELPESVAPTGDASASTASTMPPTGGKRGVAVGVGVGVCAKTGVPENTPVVTRIAITIAAMIENLFNDSFLYWLHRLSIQCLGRGF